MLEQFHFLEPLWLLAVIPLIFIFWLAFQEKTDSRAWERVVDTKLLSLLLQGEDKNSNLLPKFLLAIAWLITTIALADPVWEKIPRPIFQTNAARVLVLDLSNSMLIDDLKPSRLARARFKIEDILSREEEGQTGLVLFAGEAFTASPLTRDTETIRSILKILTPQIMPAQGSRADLGLSKAHELLKQSGIRNGQVLLITDGASKKTLGIKEARSLRQNGHSVSVMAVGTENGGTLNFRNKTSILVKLEVDTLTEIAESGGGNYSLISTNNNDLKSLLAPISDSNLNDSQNANIKNPELQNRDWKSTGPFLVLFLLPFAALAFRRGWLLNVLLTASLVGFLSQPQTVIAAEDEPIGNQGSLQSSTPSKWENLVEHLSKNKAQRVSDALIKQQYQKVIDISDDPLSKGSAEYKLEDYENALDSFKQVQGADARYNEGNTLAKLQKYKEAIAAYDDALKIDSTMQDALDNKKIIQDFLKKQQESDKNQQSSNENQQGNSDSKNENQDQQSSDSKQNSDENKGSQSAKNDGVKDSASDDENQFSDANKDLEKNKKEGEEEDIQTAKQQDDEGKDEDKEAQTGKESEDSLSDIQKSDDSLNDAKDFVKEAADELSQEEKMAAEQWLRRIPDDPGGLLRRKFRYQYNQNRRNTNSTEQPW